MQNKTQRLFQLSLTFVYFFFQYNVKASEKLTLITRVEGKIKVLKISNSFLYTLKTLNSLRHFATNRQERKKFKLVIFF